MGVAKDRLAVRRVKQDRCPPVSGAGRGTGHVAEHSVCRTGVPFRFGAGRKLAHPRRLTHETDRPTVVAMRARRHAGSPRRRACASTLGAPYGARGNSGPARHPSDGEAHHSFLSPGVIPQRETEGQVRVSQTDVPFHRFETVDTTRQHPARLRNAQSPVATFKKHQKGAAKDAGKSNEEDQPKLIRQSVKICGRNAYSRLFSAFIPFSG